MIIDAVITLIKRTATNDATGVARVTETAREILARAGNVTRAEYFSASRAGLLPAFVFYVQPIDYEGEELLEYNGTRYAVYRTYRGALDVIELYAQQESGVTYGGDN